MATIVLTAAAAVGVKELGWGALSFGAAALLGLGGMAGSFIDQSYIFPALFPADDVRAPKLDDIEIMVGSAGSPIRRSYGPATRHSGAVIWLGTLEDEEVEIEADGKGGQGGNVVDYNYWRDLAVCICEGETPSIGLTEIWAEGKLMFTRVGVTQFTSTLISASVISTFKYFGGTVTTMKISSTAAGPDLTQFKTGMMVAVSGFGTGANNGTFWIKKVWSDGSGSYMEVNNASVVAETAGASVTLAQTRPNLDTSLAAAITFYPGSTTQTADSIIQAAEGAANTPAFRRRAYVVISNLNIMEFGRRLPTLEFVMKADNSPYKLHTCIADILENEAGLSSDDYDVSAVQTADIDLEGYTIQAPESVRDSLQPLIGYGRLLARPSQGKLEFIVRDGSNGVTIDENDLGATGGGEPSRWPIQIEKQSSPIIPGIVTLSYRDSSANYQRRVKRAIRVTRAGDRVYPVKLDMTMDPDDAQALADRILWAMQSNASIVQFNLPPSYYWLQSGDLIEGLSVHNTTIDVLVYNAKWGANWLRVIEGVIEESQTLT